MSEYNQQSFIGGMNLLVDDTRLQPNQYRLAFNCHNRYDVLDSVFKSVLDTNTPAGIMQEITTFGEYVILFVSGNAYFRHYSQEVWTQIAGFGMSIDAPRFWTVSIPVAVTNYGRLAKTVDINGQPVVSSLAGIASSQSIAAAFGGNTPGLLVQDNINQPRFIYLGDNGFPVVRITQTYEEWSAEYGTGDQYGVLLTDNREYVPIGSTMAWADSILYIASQDGNTIYRSVSGRPLDFVVNINIDGTKGGDATTTSYSVGVGGITCLRPNNDGSLFVAAGNSNFVVQKNMSNIALTMFVDFFFIRRFLFEATCL